MLNPGAALRFAVYLCTSYPTSFAIESTSLRIPNHGRMGGFKF